MKISQLVEQYMAVLPLGSLLLSDQVERSLRDATRMYCGYAALISGQVIDSSATAVAGSDQDIDLSLGELAIIRPLWMLYLERENSMALEASRTQGAELFGRSVAEVQTSIQEYEQRLPLQAFSADIVSI